jgi:hypothetical protein
MSEQHDGAIWEYCILREDVQTATRGGLVLEYEGATNNTRSGLTLMQLGRVIGLLGHGGWELVSVLPSSFGDAGTFYFKRPVLLNRSVDQPELNL